jgi:Skp family chaperone for outer membrane proteins
MRSMHALSLACLIAALPLGASRAADLKIGVLDVQSLFQNYEGYAEALKIFNKDLEAWQAQKQQMLDELTAARDNFSVQRLMMTPETQQERQAEIAQKEGELYQFDQEKFGPEGEAARRNMELSEPIYEKIRQAVKTIAEEDGYDLVFDVNGVLVYWRPEISLDARVAAAINAKG